MARKQKKYHYIYKTINLKNGKYYIGMHSTDNLDDGYMGSGKNLKRSLNKHGKSNFKFEILEFLPDRESLVIRENQIVNEKLVKDSMSMNLKKGGLGGFINDTHKKKFIEASKKSRGIALKNGREKQKKLRKENKSWTDSLKKNISNGLKRVNFNHNTFLGKKHTNKSKKLISEKNSINQKGEKNSQYGTCWITNGKETKKIKKENIGEFLTLGWRKGRV
jgi:hypothetical protein